MRIRWTPPAVKDMQGISDYLKDHHPRYRPGRIEGTREILFSPMPYVAVYRVHEQAIEVWRIRHTAQSRSN
jgi:plasmid stabilization system protein ParE